MNLNRHLRARSSCGLLLLLAVGATGCSAVDLLASHSFMPAITPPGYSKKGQLALHGVKGEMSVLDAAGDWTPLGRYLFDLASDPANMAAHVHYLFSTSSGNWREESSPLYRGTVPVNQGHRLPRLLPAFVALLRASGEIPEDVKARLMPPGWQDGCEAVYRGMIDEHGLLAHDGNVGTMALSFHSLRTGWVSMGLRPERIYTLAAAQRLVRTLLSDPDVLNAVDRWLPADDAFVARFATAYAPEAPEVRAGTVLFTGGLFIGWKTSLPSLHATWDGLTTINSLFSFYPEPDPAKPNSIFLLWNALPAERKMLAHDAFALLTARLWRDWAEHQGPCWCRIVDGKPSEDPGKPSAAIQLYDHAGYSEKDFCHWAALSWQEVYGDPSRNTTNGVQALLAILDGRVLSTFKVPSGAQKRPAENDDADGER